MRCHPPASALEFPTPGHVADLESLIQHQLGAFVGNFHLSASDAGLVLHGTARSYYAKQVAQHAVMNATAVPIAANQIEVI